MSLERATLFVGSARPTGESTSETLGRYLVDRLEGAGAKASIHRASHARKGTAERELMASLDDSDLFVLSTPLYVDSLPYLVTDALERIVARREFRGPDRPTGLLAIVNCGFPEADHTATAIDICRAFARRAGYAWRGGLGLGGGELIAGRPLDEVGWPARHAREALDLAAKALFEGRRVPERAIELMARPMIPHRLYTLVGDMRWRRTARRHGVGRRLDHRPYESPLEG
ncbi:MAG: hypothetical protein R3199_08645 [Gemmatimonadota bacterium]|nr:hypothetical protein [Gemmatimonadota bacterium]